MNALVRNSILLISILMGSLFSLLALPKEMSADFYLEFHRGGGMRPDFIEYFFSKGLSFIKEKKNGKEEILCFRMDPGLLRNLYASLLKNRFERIETRTEKISDRGGERVQVGMDRKTYNKSDSGMTLIQPLWKSNWKNILEDIQKTKLLSTKDSPKIRFSLRWKNFQEPLSFNMSAENRTLFYQYQIQQSRFDEVAFYFLPGTYKLQFEFLEDKAKFYNHEVEFTVDRDSKEVSFFCNPEGCVRH